MWSIALHGVVMYVASRVEWASVRSGPPPPPAVVWLEDWPIGAPEPIASEPSEPVEPVVEAEPEDEEAADAEAEPVEDAAEDERTAATESPAVDTPVDAETPASEVATESVEAEPSPDTDSGSQRRSRNYIVREVDWDEERRRAVARVREQQLLDNNYLTFSLDDVIDEPLPEEPNLAENIFDAPENSRPPSLLSPDKARSAFGQRMARLCNDLLGGIGLGFNGMAFGSLCADYPPATLFSSIKPRYLRARPVCTEAPEAVAAGTDGAASVKCRLVVDGEERIEE